MGAFEWIAIIGAAAWVPHIAVAIYKLVVRPHLTLIPSPTPEVGYSLLGPVFNFTCAFAAKRKDAIIERMTVVITHENGESRLLTWTIMNETFSELRSHTGETAEFTKRQPALALKVSTTLLTEKLIGFQDATFAEKRNVLANSVIAIMNHLKKTEDSEADGIAATLKSKEFAALLDFYSQQFFWKVGTYEAVITVQMLGQQSVVMKRLTFELTADDTTRLENNLHEIQRVASDIVKNLPADQRTPEQYNWANPPLRVQPFGAPRRLKSP